MADLKTMTDDPPEGISGAPREDNIMLWDAVIFGYLCFYHYIIMFQLLRIELDWFELSKSPAGWIVYLFELDWSTNMKLQMEKEVVNAPY